MGEAHRAPQKAAPRAPEGRTARSKWHGVFKPHRAPQAAPRALNLACPCSSSGKTRNAPF